MTSPPTEFRFNAWHDPWIQVVDLAGDVRMLGIGAALAAAHDLYGLADSSPLVAGGTQRLLTAVLQFIYAPGEVADVGAILAAGRLDAARLAEFERAYAARFELFDAAAPFLQTGDVARDAWIKPAGHKAKGDSAPAIKPKTIAYLFADTPSETNRTLYHHVVDDGHRLCPACCLAGLVVQPTFAQNGGRGWRASVNGDPPLYLFPVGGNFFESLALSLMSTAYQPKTTAQARRASAPWTRDPLIPKEGGVSQIGYIESLTFPARRVRLFPQADAGFCTRCGVESAVRVATMVWEPGLWRQQEAEIWIDPFVAYFLGSDKKLRPLKVTTGKALWREYSTLFLSGNERLPSVVRQIGQLFEDDDEQADISLLRFRCVGMKTDGKAKVFEWMDDAIEVPSGLLNNAAGASLVREALDRAELCERILGLVFAQHSTDRKPGGKNQSGPLQGIKTRMLDGFWAALAQPFRDLVREAASGAALAELPARWEIEVISTGKRLLEAALDQRGDSANLLRTRSEALNHYHGTMAKYRKEGWNVKRSR